MNINPDIKVDNHTLSEIETEAFLPYKVSEVFVINTSVGWNTNNWNGSVLNYTYPITFKKTYVNKPALFVTCCDPSSATYWGGLRGNAGVTACRTTGCQISIGNGVSPTDLIRAGGWISLIVISND